MGFADQVFIGLVLSKEGQTEEYGWPETQFRVKILETLKGTANQGDVITVNQEGGTYGDGAIHRDKNAPYLLASGSGYLFVTRSLPEKNWHTLVSGYGNIKIDPAKDGNGIYGLDSRQVAELRSRFSAAIQDEIPFEEGSPDD